MSVLFTRIFSVEINIHGLYTTADTADGFVIVNSIQMRLIIVLRFVGADHVYDVFPPGPVLEGLNADVTNSGCPGTAVSLPRLADTVVRYLIPVALCPRL